MTELGPTYAPGAVGHKGAAGLGWITGRCAAGDGLLLIVEPGNGFRFIANLFGGKFRAKVYHPFSNCFSICCPNIYYLELQPP